MHSQPGHGAPMVLSSPRWSVHLPLPRSVRGLPSYEALIETCRFATTDFLVLPPNTALILPGAYVAELRQALDILRLPSFFFSSLESFSQLPSLSSFEVTLSELLSSGTLSHSFTAIAVITFTLFLKASTR